MFFQVYVWIVALFFQNYERIFSENGDISNLDEAYYRGTGMEIAGYDFDLDNGVLSLVACDFREEPTLQELKKNIMDVKFKHLENFFNKSKQNRWFEELEETSASFNLAFTINEIGNPASSSI